MPIDPVTARETGRTQAQEHARHVSTIQLLTAIGLVVVLSMAAIAALTWALSQSNDTVKQLSTESQCRSAVAQQEAAALDDIIISLGRRQPVTEEQINTLASARDHRQSVINNGCS